MGSEPYGLTGTAAGSSCGAIAIHNALKLLGQYSNFNDVYDTFSENPAGTNFHGIAGTNPIAMSTFLKGYGLENDVYGPFGAEKAVEEHDAGIILYIWYTPKAGNKKAAYNVHYQAYEKNSIGIYETYNPRSTHDSYVDMLMDNDMIGIISVWGISK